MFTYNTEFIKWYRVTYHLHNDHNLSTAGATHYAVVVFMLMTFYDVREHEIATLAELYV